MCVRACTLNYFGSLVLEPDLHHPDTQTSLSCQGLSYLGLRFRRATQRQNAKVKKKNEEVI